MKSDFRRTSRGRWARAAILTALGLTAVSHAALAEKKPFRIGAQDATITLTEFAKQGGIQILFAYERVKGITTNAVEGQYEPVDAIALLVKGTGLQVSERDGGVFFVEPQKTDTGAMLLPENDSTSQQSIWSRMQLSQAEQGGAPQSSSVAADSQGSESTPQLEEIVVTAQKRAERLIDVPQSVTVLSADTLSKQGIVQFRDFANTIPGLTFNTAGVGYNQISIRGVTVGFNLIPTVAIYLDEVPYGSSSSATTSANLGFDAGLFDMERIEVLRGPQGTLYGASAMGGLIKYVSRLRSGRNGGNGAGRHQLQHRRRAQCPARHRQGRVARQRLRVARWWLHR
jgi:hypothetical protein